MDAKQIALKLVLDELHEEADIGSVQDRVRIQKAVYLAQALGVNLGYSYSWYVRGPYSTSLTRDYYALDEALAAGDEDGNGMVLHPSVQARIPAIREVLAKPPVVQLDKWKWYELLASLHFLLVSSGYTFEKACQFLRSAKPHLDGYFEVGLQHLRAHRLVAV